MLRKGFFIDYILLKQKSKKNHYIRYTLGLTALWVEWKCLNCIDKNKEGKEKYLPFAIYINATSLAPGN